MMTPKEKLVIQAIAENIADYNTERTISSSETSSSESSASSDERSVTTKRARIDNFMETVDEYSDLDFKKHFRLSRETIASLVGLYESSGMCPSHKHGGRPKVGARKEIHLFVWYVANTVTYRQMGNLFGMGETTTWKVVNRVAAWMVSISHQYIVWPRQPQQIRQTTEAFRIMGGITGVLGAIDGSHIKIKKPSENQEIYFNRKGYHSIVLQAVVDSSKRFIDVYCGEPGSMHDARVLRRSPLFRLASENSIFNDDTFLLGDSAYPSNVWLVPPFKDTGNLTEQQRKFNQIHSSSRIVIENAFGLMKCRFRRLLHFTEHIDLGTVKNIVVACAMLHNICVNAKDQWDESEVEQDDHNTYSFNSSSEDTSGMDRRQRVIDQLRLNNLL